MPRTKIKISEEDYNKLFQSSRKEVSDYVLNIANNSTIPPCGYGFSYPRVFKENDICYASWEYYDSCD